MLLFNKGNGGYRLQGYRVSQCFPRSWRFEVPGLVRWHSEVMEHQFGGAWYDRTTIGNSCHTLRIIC